MTTVTFWTKYLQAGLPFSYSNNEFMPCTGACEDCIYNSDTDYSHTCGEHAHLSSEDLRALMSKFPEAFL